MEVKHTKSEKTNLSIVTSTIDDKIFAALKETEYSIMKRMLYSPHQSQSKKLMKWNQSQLDKVDLSNEERKLNFKLTDKKVRSNLLKSAERRHLEVEHKQNCTNIRFSPGAYLFVGKKLIDECEEKQKQGSVFVYENLSIKVDEFKTGKELNNKHFDTKIVFAVDGQKVVIHCYNSTQNLKVEGSIYLSFIDRFLYPLLITQVQDVKESIAQYDSKLKETFSTKKPMRGMSVKSINNSINQKLSTCKKCDRKFNNMSDLKMHKHTDHNVSQNNLHASDLSNLVSTRNNSSDEVLLCEDITLEALELEKDKVAEVVLAEKVPTNILQEEVNEEAQIDTIQEVINEEVLDDVDTDRNLRSDNNKCSFCQTQCKDKISLKVHYNDHHNTVYIECDKCEYSAFDLDVLKQHKMNHTGSSIFQCYHCEFEFTKQSLLREHIESKHKKPVIFQCYVCDAIFPQKFLLDKHKCYLCRFCKHTENTKSALEIHIQITHQTINVNVPKITVVKCQFCEYTCKLNIQMKKHVDKNHTIVEEEGFKYSCEKCEFRSDFYLHMWEHTEEYHMNRQLPPPAAQRSDLLMEMNIDILEEMKNFKQDMKKAFLTLADSFVAKLDDLNNKLNAGSSKKDVSSELPEANEKVVSSEAINKHDDKKVEKSDPPSKRRRRPRKHRPIVKWLGSSVSKELDEIKLEQDCNASVEFVEVASIKEGQKSLVKVVPEVIENDDVDLLVLQAGEMEISNLPVNAAILDTNKDISVYKREWFNQVEEDTKKIFAVAEDAVKQNPNLHVVVVKKFPRFDRGSTDVLSLKPTLSNYANGVLDQLWLKAGSPENIQISEINLNIEKPGYLKDIIYGSSNSENYDGVHLRGSGACRHLNYRAKQVLKPIVSAKFGQSLSHRSRQIQSRRKISYTDAVRSNAYSVPTSNRFDFLG